VLLVVLVLVLVLVLVRVLVWVLMLVPCVWCQGAYTFKNKQSSSVYVIGG
jgi:hypothetical protein